jgi:hypothetical protein
MKQDFQLNTGQGGFDMKKVMTAVLLAGLVGLFGLAAEILSFKGDIIDNMCAAENKDNLGDFLKTHAKECALMTHCVASGYSIYADGKLYSFDQASNKKIEEFLRQADSRLQVVVRAEKAGKELTLVSIQNQK